MIAALALAAAVGIALPHALRLERTNPAIAAFIWVSALSVRALAAVLAAAWLILYFPATEQFAALTRWCLHGLAVAHLNGHDVGHVATLAPAALVAASLLSAVVGLRRLRGSLRRLADRPIGVGPHGSLIVGGQSVTLAVVGLRRPRLLVSAGALLELDDDELAAGLAHERAHVARRHRYALVYAELCRAVARLLPGSRHAAAQVAFHLERDADRWAVRHRVDGRALARALGKASRPLPGGGLVVALGAGGLDERVAELLDGRPPRRSAACRAAAAALAGMVVALTLALAPVVHAGVRLVRETPAALDCERQDSYEVSDRM